MKKSFDNRDIAQIEKHGIYVEGIDRQIKCFQHGFGYLKIRQAAGVGNGVFSYDSQKEEKYIGIYREASPSLTTVKFVPASGAATRMFKDLHTAVSTGEVNPKLSAFLGRLDETAFAGELYRSPGEDDIKKTQAILDYGGELPKGLILFHNYPDGPRTAFEEHLVEGAIYARNGDRVNLHFTVSPEHEEGFRRLLERVRPKYELKHGVKYNVSFSFQDPSTDTIAVTPDNEPFRGDDGSLVFRPGGHGALIHNLNGIDADLIFIKNIDNVTPDRLKGDTVRYKELIGGKLLSVRTKIFRLLDLLNKDQGDLLIAEALKFINHHLCTTMPESFYTMNNAQKAEVIRAILDRPLRVCGMVRNEGEPGGGPFLAENPDGTVSPQIGEPSQVSPADIDLLNKGTYFNPVDIVCSVKDRQGRKYDLTKYVDQNTGFISEKSKDGKPLKALELPGLWNGAMSAWNTIFVEVPGTTFTPVKEIYDLLREEHR